MRLLFFDESVVLPPILPVIAVPFVLFILIVITFVSTRRFIHGHGINNQLATAAAAPLIIIIFIIIVIPIVSPTRSFTSISTTST